jgi:hypothetical protein
MRMMKQSMAVLVLLGCASLGMAQDSATAGSASIGKELDQVVSNVEREFVPAAEAMPEAQYSFAPTNGEFKGVRTFAKQVKHVAAVNYVVAAAILEEKPPVDLGGENGPDAMQSKADIVKFLKDSFAYAHKAILTINEKNAVKSIKPPFGDHNTTPIAMATLIVGHCFDHYGQMVEYLRMNGIVPPASR